MAIGDFNGDGNLDLVNGESVHLGNGNGTLDPRSSMPAPASTVGCCVSLARPSSRLSARG